MRRKLLLAAAALVGLLALALWVALYTNMGLRTAFTLAKRWVPGSLQFATVSGRLAGPMQLQGLRFQAEDIDLTVARLDLDWRPLGLFSKAVEISQISAEDVELRLVSKPPQSAAPGRELPAVTSDWAVRLVRSEVNGLRVMPQGFAPIELRRIDLAVTLVAGALELSLAADDSRGKVQVAANIDTRSRYRHTFNVAFNPVNGEEIRLESIGDADSLRLEALAARWDARLSATITDPLGELKWSAEGQGTLPSLERVTASGSGSLSGADLNVRLKAGEWVIDAKPLKLQWSAEGLRMFDSVVAIPGIARRVELSGTLATGAEPHFEVALEATADTSVPALGKYLEAATTHLSVNGALESARLEGVARLTTHQGVLEVDYSGMGDRNGLGPLHLDIRQGEAKLQLLGSLSWSDGLSWRFDLSGSQLNPAVIWVDWPAALNLRGHSSGRVVEEQIDASVDLDEIGGRFLGNPIVGRASTRLSGRGVESLNADLQIADNRITGEGHWAEQRDVQVQARIVDLGQILPGATGALQLSLSMKEEGAGLALTGSGGGTALSWNGLEISKLGFAARSSGILHGLDAAELHLGALTYAGANAEGLDLTAGGPWDALELTAELRSTDLGRVSLEATVDAADQARSGRFRRIAWNGQFGAWSLREAAGYRIENSILILDTLCLDRQPGLFCAGVSGTQETQHWDVRIAGLPAELAQLPLSIALERPVKLGGEISANLTALVMGDSLDQLSGEFEASEASLSLDFGNGWQALPLGAIRATVNADTSALSATANTASELFSADLELSLADPLGAPGGALEARLRAEVGELAKLAPWFDLPVELGGRGELELNLAGSAAEPVIDGKVSLADVVLEVPEYGSRWRNGSLEARLETDRSVTLNGAIDAEKGTIQVRGTANYATGEARINLAGEGVQVAQTPSLLLEISPDLEFIRAAGGYQLRGNLEIVNATIEQFETAQSVSPSPDVVVVDAPAGEEAAPEGVPLTTDIRVRFKQPAQLKGYGMNAQLSGELHVVDTPGETVLATGELRVGGSYQAYGQNLTIDEGRLIYAQTPLDNPSIRADAYRQIGEVRAGVRVSGRVAEPQLSLYSTPTMGDTEILHYLILGRARGAAGGDFDSSAMVTNAALQLGLSQGNNVVGQVGSKLGLDLLSIDVDEEFGGAAVSIGRYLSPRLYVSYSTGLVQAIDLLRFEYRLGRKWSIQSEIGLQTRATVSYELETGRAKKTDEDH